MDHSFPNASGKYGWFCAENRWLEEMAAGPPANAGNRCACFWDAEIHIITSKKKCAKRRSSGRKMAHRWCADLLPSRLYCRCRIFTSSTPEGARGLYACAFHRRSGISPCPEEPFMHLTVVLYRRPTGLSRGMNLSAPSVETNSHMNRP